MSFFRIYYLGGIKRKKSTLCPSLLMLIRVDYDCERCGDQVDPKCTIMLAISCRAISTDILRQTALLIPRTTTRIYYRAPSSCGVL